MTDLAPRCSSCRVGYLVEGRCASGCPGFGVPVNRCAHLGATEPGKSFCFQCRALLCSACYGQHDGCEDNPRSSSPKSVDDAVLGGQGRTGADVAEYADTILALLCACIIGGAAVFVVLALVPAWRPW